MHMHIHIDTCIHIYIYTHIELKVHGRDLVSARRRVIASNNFAKTWGNLYQVIQKLQIRLQGRYNYLVTTY